MRTTVAANTLTLYSELVTSLGPALDGFTETLYINLLKMASLTKKIIAQQSQTTVTTMIANTSPQPRVVLPLLWNMIQDKAVQVRQYGINHMKSFLEINGARAKHSIESGGGLDHIDKSIKKSLIDPNPGVKEGARQAFWQYHAVWTEKARVIMATLDSISRKQLEKACPDPSVLENTQVPATPQVKKSSVAAAIAASRAKARAIATAPPSLRHQATSTARTVSPPSTKRPLSPSLSNSTSSGGGTRATSPISRLASSGGSPPRARIVSTGGLSRSTSSGFVPVSHSREASKNTSPLPAPDTTHKRRVSSPPVHTSPNNSSTLRRAAQTALPASPSASPSAFPATPTPAPQHKPIPYPGLPRDSLNIAGLHLYGHEEESLLLASNIPIPEDDDSEMDIDMDESLNLISFSTPYEKYPPPTKSAASFSPRSTSSKPTHANTISQAATSPRTNHLPQPVVEDALRARAEQAESAAQRLLELVEPEDEDMDMSIMPPSLLLGSTEATPKLKTKSVIPGPTYTTPSVPMPKTPVNKGAANLRRAALFQDSPARNGSTSVFDMIDSRKTHSAWWMKRLSRKCPDVVVI